MIIDLKECCENCENEYCLTNTEPCVNCELNGCEGDNIKNNFEPKSWYLDENDEVRVIADKPKDKVRSKCESCKHEHLKSYEEPCVDCMYFEYYEPKDDPTETVNHPTHYQNENGLECIEVMELLFGRKAVIDFCRCNIFKYRYRADNKNGAEDLKKAEWYENYLNKLLKCEVK